MKALILKEWREHLKWVPLPGLVILLVFSIEKPEEPMTRSTAEYYYCLTAVVFAAALGFLQIVFEAHGDKRSLLLHRPLSPSRIFLAKALAGVGLYLLALGIPFLCLETWKARPGNMPAPYHWRMSLPWLADILSGLVYYFAGMLTAQRAARWYGSRGLALAGAFFCSCLVWALTEFWQALVAIGIIGSFVGVAAWGSFSAGGEYARQPRLARAGLAMTFLAALLILSMLGKQMIGEWSDSGFRWDYGIDRQGRMMVAPLVINVGFLGPWTDLNGQELPGLKRPMFPGYDGKGDINFEAPRVAMEIPHLYWSYRNPGRFFAELQNDSKPGNEVWYFDLAEGHLVGYDKSYHQLVGRFGPDGFTPAGVPPGERFHGELRYFTRYGYGQTTSGCLVCSDGVYAVDFARRTIRTFFSPAAGETVTFGRDWNDQLNREWKRVFVSTDRSIHVLTEDGAPLLSIPRVQTRQNKKYLVQLGRLENPERYFAWYPLLLTFAEPAESRSTPLHFHEYDTSGHELAHRSGRTLSPPAASYAKALFGAVTPMTEAAALVGASRFLRREARRKGSTRLTVLLAYLENIRYYIPGTSRYEETPSGLVPGYIALIVLSGAAGAMGCWLLARRYAFSRGRSIMWAHVGFFFGWVGWLLMLVVQQWPARVSCPTCRQLRVVTRDTCEHCGGLHTPPASDGTEIFEIGQRATANHTDSEITGGLTMKALIFKEWQEHLKWVPLPGLAILLMFLINKPGEPMPDVTVAFFLCLTGVLFGTALGFLQVFFEGHGDPRSLLFHRPLSPSRVFLAKAIAGMSLYLLALGIPFVCLETWKARPGNLLAPYHWRTSLPWLADILSGLVYYFAGMLTAQRDVRWYGSRGLALAAAFLCSFLVWVLPEFWQALLAIAIIGLLVSLAAWGSICTGGAYAPQPRFAKAALAMTFLAGLLIVGMFCKQMIGEWFDPGFYWKYIVDRQGREVAMPYAMGRGSIGTWTDLEGHELPDLNRSEDLPRLTAPSTVVEAPLFWSYRDSGRFYVECRNETKPGNERWYYDQAQGRLVGRHLYYHHLLGSFGPDGFTPPGEQPGQRFQGELRYENDRWYTFPIPFLAFPGRVYSVDFARRTIRTLFTPSAGETVVGADDCEDRLTKHEWVVVGTDKSFHFLTEEGSPMVSMPRVHDCYGYLVALGTLEKPERYFAWYRPDSGALFVEPQEFKTAPFHLHEYDPGGRELAHRDHPQRPYPAASYAKAFFGLVTPMTEVATLVRLSQSLRSEGRSKRSTRQPVILDYLENMRYFVPGTSRFEGTPGGLIPGYVALILLSAAASALGCFVLARRSAFSRARGIGWALVGMVFGWVGLVLMLVLQERPARVSCPECRKLRVVIREMCEHCGALHSAPGFDGTEIFEPMDATPVAALLER